MVKFHRALSDSAVHFRYFGLIKLEQRIAMINWCECVLTIMIARLRLSVSEMHRKRKKTKSSRWEG